MLQRNRLIAATARATVVVEAGVRSGSLNTAAHAGSLGRPIGAVPGPVTSLASAGCHRLLRDFDAVCVTSADDVVDLVTTIPRAGRVLQLEATSIGFGDRQGDARVTGDEPYGGAGAGGRATSTDGGDRPGVQQVTQPGGQTLRSAQPQRPRGRVRPAEQVRVLDAMSRRVPRSSGDIAVRTGLSLAMAQATLGALGLEGTVEEVAGGWRVVTAR